MNTSVVSLTNAPSEVQLTISIVSDENVHVLGQHGIIAGEKIKILSKSSFQPLLLEVRNSLIAIDVFYAKNVFVQNNFS